MPTVFIVGAYRFFFYAGDGAEPAHIHVERDDKVAKFWLDPIRLQRNSGFNRTETAKLRVIIEDHQVMLMEAWNAYFGG